MDPVSLFIFGVVGMGTIGVGYYFSDTNQNNKKLKKKTDLIKGLRKSNIRQIGYNNNNT